MIVTESNKNSEMSRSLTAKNDARAAKAELLYVPLRHFGPVRLNWGFDSASSKAMLYSGLC